MLPVFREINPLQVVPSRKLSHIKFKSSLLNDTSDEEGKLTEWILLINVVYWTIGHVIELLIFTECS